VRQPQPEQDFLDHVAGGATPGSPSYTQALVLELGVTGGPTTEVLLFHRWPTVGLGGQCGHRGHALPPAAP
jgi:hypothetical protein